MVKRDDKTATFCPANRVEWRNWLMKNHQLSAAVWLVQYSKKSGKASISWSEAVEEALCFGWIDSIRKKVDEDTFIQFFSKRKPGGTWSKINKDKVEELIQTGRMSEAGLKSIEIAKANGAWTILDEAEELIVPKDLATALKAYSGAALFFSSLSKSVKKAILIWIVIARKAETRQNRINEVAKLASQKLKPKHLR
ncbi:YdeI/OmpD-associated family protein [Pedobacter aquatilis]|uniref:YdeI/OmpD-associated family protein n=1 Tax=Pedobacter aquatilis TaxID=351343 RepID=UPI00293107BF|nr:YdeI/OmpD-associated family protein [Pedobacter aquatilis]